MGTLPATGQEISIGKIARAFGLEASYPPSGGSNIGLNSTLGVNREPPQASGTTAQQTAIPANSTTKESEDFGGLDTPNNYPT